MISFTKAAFGSQVAKTALVAIAHGAEELESVAVIDTLVRAKVNVTVAKVLGKEDQGKFDSLEC